MDHVNTVADRRSRHRSISDRRHLQIFEDTNRSRQNRIREGIVPEGVPIRKITFSYSLPDHHRKWGVSRGAPSHKLSIYIQQFKTENFQRTKQNKVSRQGRQVWHARSPGLAEVPGDNTLWLYVAVRNKQGINCLGG